MMRPPPRSTLFPYTPLFRSRRRARGATREGFHVPQRRRLEVVHGGRTAGGRPGAPLLLRGARGEGGEPRRGLRHLTRRDRKSTRLNSSHANISYAVFCLKKK